MGKGDPTKDPDPTGDAAPTDGRELTDGELTGNPRPTNELELTLIRALRSGARASLLRAIARSSLCLLAEPAPELGLTALRAGLVDVPCVRDEGGAHALLYTSRHQLAHANHLMREPPWLEVAAGSLFAAWPADVDIWLNAGTPLGCPLEADDAEVVAAIAAGLEVDEAYEIGPDDEYADYPGPSLPDETDVAVVMAVFDSPAVLEVSRFFRRLVEPAGRNWRMMLVLVDSREAPARERQQIARLAAQAVNDATEECCEVHVADVTDDDIVEVVGPLINTGVPLWRRDSYIPGTDLGEFLDQIDVLSLESGNEIPETPPEEPGS